MRRVAGDAGSATRSLQGTLETVKFVREFAWKIQENRPVLELVAQNGLTQMKLMGMDSISTRFGPMAASYLSRSRHSKSAEEREPLVDR